MSLALDQPQTSRYQYYDPTKAKMGDHDSTDPLDNSAEMSSTEQNPPSQEDDQGPVDA
jgi:hypothetical protein